MSVTPAHYLIVELRLCDVFRATFYMDMPSTGYSWACVPIPLIPETYKIRGTFGYSGEPPPMPMAPGMH